jgi:hypothetical protein
MPNKKLLNGIPNSITQQYFSTIFYYSRAYMADWIWEAASEKNHNEFTIDILNKTVTPADMHTKPITVYLDYLQHTIQKNSMSVGFDKDFIVQAKFDIRIYAETGLQASVSCIATLVDKEGEIYIGKTHTEKALIRDLPLIKSVVKKLTLMGKIKRAFKF